MKIAFKIILFTFMLNIASGILIFTMPNLDPAYSSILTPIADQTQGRDELINSLEGNVTLPSTSSESSNVKDVLLDAFFIGKIIKFVKGIGTLLFGFIKMLESALLMFTPTIGATAYIAFLAKISSALATILSLGYGLGVFWLWTGKAFTD